MTSSNLLIGRTTAQVLAEFGTPDEAFENTASVVWVYHGADGERSIYFHIHDGMVFRMEIY